MGGERLHPVLRRLPAARWSHGRPARPPPAVHRRPRPVRRRLARRWSRDLAGHADRRAGGPGARRRAAVTGGAVARHRHLQGGRRAQQGDGRLGRGRRLRRRRGRAARRRADRVRRLGVGPVRQHADRHRGGVPRPAAAPREQERGHAQLRRRRRGHGDRRPDAARLHAGRRQRRRLAVRADARPRRGRARVHRGVHRHRDAVEGAARPVQLLPPAHDHRDERRRAARGDGAVLDVLLRVALHAARARATTRSRPGWRTCRWPSGSSSPPAWRPGW